VEARWPFWGALGLATEGNRRIERASIRIQALKHRENRALLSGLGLGIELCLLADFADVAARRQKYAVSVGTAIGIMHENDAPQDCHECADGYNQD
jgi:hypothetical protein